jgi:transposase-like protein
VVPDVSARSLEGFLSENVAQPATVATDGWSGYAGLAAAGYAHEPVNLAASWGDAALRLPAIHLVFGLAKRWLLGTHHGAVSKKRLPSYLDEFTFRFNRRTATSIAHRFARVVEQIGGMAEVDRDERQVPQHEVPSRTVRQRHSHNAEQAVRQRREQPQP